MTSRTSGLAIPNADLAAGRASCDVPSTLPIKLLLFYVGLAFTMPRVSGSFVPIVSLSLLVALGLAVLGWLAMDISPPLRTYLWAAVPMAIAMMLSSVSLWETHAVAESAKTAGIWSLFIVPGLAVLFREPGNRRPFIFGAAGGLAYYCFLRAFWLLIGSPLSAHQVDVNADGSIASFLGANRNDLDLFALLLLPLVWLGSEGRRIPLRRVFAVLFVFWLYTSGGRSGYVFLPLMALAYVLILPGVSRRARAVVGLLAVALLLVAGSAFFRVPTSGASNRVITAFTGERESGDEKRVLLNRRAWHLGWQSPLVGHGFGRIQGQDDPALDAARTPFEREAAREGGIHNRYLWMFASFGLPAVIAFIAVLGIAIAWGMMLRFAPDARWVTVSLLGIAGALLLHTAHSETTDFVVALSLGVSMQYFAARTRNA